MTAGHQARLLHRPQQDRVVTGWLRSAGCSVNGGVQWAYAAMLLVAIAAALVDAIELRLPDPMTYSILAAGVVVMAVFEITGTHQGLVRGIVGSVLYGGLLLGAGLLDPRSYALGDIKLCAGLGVWIGGNSWASLYIGILTAQVLLLLVGCIVWARDKERGREFTAGPSLVAGAILGVLTHSSGHRPIQQAPSPPPNPTT